MSKRKKQRLSTAVEEPITTYDRIETQSQGIAPSQSPQKQSTISKAKSLFVHSLPTSTTDDSLSKHFSQLYPLKHATVVLDSVNKQSKGYGFVTFADAEDAQNARSSLNGSLLDGKKIKVELAEPRHRQSGINGKIPHAKDGVSHAVVKQHNLGDYWPSKLIVRNLPWTFKDPEHLAKLFRSYGKVKFITLPKKPSGLSPGYGFVTFRGRKTAEKALEGINGKEVDGRTLAVDWAVEKDTWSALQNQSEALLSGVEDKMTTDPLRENDDDEAEDVLGTVSGDDVDSSSTSTIEELPSSDEERSDSDSATSKPAYDTTILFIRNLPFSVTDVILQEHFSLFGRVRYARVVLDQSTKRSKGTAFVAFYNPEDAKLCLDESRKAHKAPSGERAMPILKPSALENIRADPTGHFTIDGRVLHISQAVDRGEANRLTAVGNSLRETRDKDKRRLYLLSEGTVPSNSPLCDQLSPSDIKLREDSAKQRQALVRSNPSLHLSLTRLSVRNLPRTMTSKDLKELARRAVVGFATDVKEEKRQPLSKEELARGGKASKEAERARKVKGKGIVRQAKIVFEGVEGGKVQEKSGAGRSRGYGFIEYTSHRWALMGLRWLNGHAVTPQLDGDQQKSRAPEDRKRRLIIEFAIENAQVVARRQEREAHAGQTYQTLAQKPKLQAEDQPSSSGVRETVVTTRSSRKRKRTGVSNAGSADLVSSPARTNSSKATYIDQLNRRQQIIRKKRMLRKARKRNNPT